MSYKTALELTQTPIQWNTNTQGALSIYDISGREVLKEESKTNGAHTTDIKQLKSGIYFIKLKDNDKAMIEKYCKIE